METTTGAGNTNAAVSDAYGSYATETKKTTRNKTGSYGKTVGMPQLSEEGAAYYEELKKKYGNMDFILVSKDQKANAQANAASYANSFKMVVLIDEEKIEKMATDENYRKQYEGIIRNAASGLSQLKAQMEKSGAKVKGYGMQVKDGGLTSFFAVLKKSSSDQKERIAKRGEAKKAEKKAAAKKAEKQAAEERLHGKKTDHIENDDDTVTITASSIEELMQKIDDYTMAERSDQVMTESEQQLGQHVDFKG